MWEVPEITQKISDSSQADGGLPASLNPTSAWPGLLKVRIGLCVCLLYFYILGMSLHTTRDLGTRLGRALSAYQRVEVLLLLVRHFGENRNTPICLRQIHYLRGRFEVKRREVMHPPAILLLHR